MTSALHCPVCVGSVELRLIDPHLLRAALRRCDTCLGVLASERTVSVAAEHYHESHYVMTEGHGRHGCRACGLLFDAACGACPRCGKPQTIECPQCESRMELVHIAGVTLDVCWACRMVWFDRGELGLLMRRHRAELGKRLSSPAVATAALTGPDVLTDIVTIPGVGELAVDVAVHGVAAVVEFAPDAAVLAGEAAVAAGEVAVEASSIAVDLLLEIVGEIFS